MYDKPLTWYEQENLGHMAHFEAWPPEQCGFCVSSRCKFYHKDNACRSDRPVQAFQNPTTQHF